MPWKDTVRRDLKAWNISEERVTDREKWKDPIPRTGRQWRKVRISNIDIQQYNCKGVVGPQMNPGYGDFQ